MIQMLQLLKNLGCHSSRKEIVDADILEWANAKVKNSGSQSRMDSFKVSFIIQIDNLRTFISYFGMQS